MYKLYIALGNIFTVHNKFINFCFDIQEPKQLSKNIFECAATLLACGIDPEKSILFLQSTVCKIIDD
jgi:tryptophanyl-tRNA synthetase